MCLLASSQLACSQTEQSLRNLWATRGCDTTRGVFPVSIYDLSLPLYQLDTLTEAISQTSRVYAVRVEDSKRFYWAGLYAPEGEQPTKMDSAGMAAGFYNWPMSANDRAALASLVSTPTYFYDRWLHLLEPHRKEFLEKREQLLDSLEEVYPNYQIQINSDLRSAGTQAKYLGKGASMTPLSQHQFGFAADIGAWTMVQKRVKVRGNKKKKRSRYRTVVVKQMGGTRVFNNLGDIAKSFTLYWGGDFMGFADPNHVQYFANSAALLEQIPPLRYEFEPFRNFYENRVQKMTEAGKADKVEDTRQLLEALDKLREEQPCFCHEKKEQTLAELAHIKSNLQMVGYQAEKDLLLVFDQRIQQLWVQAPNCSLRYRIGIWKN
jgi:peptidoglycan LD-endopeptidase CwlK